MSPVRQKWGRLDLDLVMLTEFNRPLFSETLFFFFTRLDSFSVSFPFPGSFSCLFLFVFPLRFKPEFFLSFIRLLSRVGAGTGFRALFSFSGFWSFDPGSMAGCELALSGLATVVLL